MQPSKASRTNCLCSLDDVGEVFGRFTDEGHRCLFYHIPYSAGTAVNLAAVKAFGSDAVHVLRRSGGHRLWNPAEAAHFRFVRLHTNLPLADFPGFSRQLTSFREPELQLRTSFFKNRNVGARIIPFFHDQPESYARYCERRLAEGLDGMIARNFAILHPELAEALSSYWQRFDRDLATAEVDMPWCSLLVGVGREEIVSLALDVLRRQDVIFVPRKTRSNGHVGATPGIDDGAKASADPATVQALCALDYRLFAKMVAAFL